MNAQTESTTDAQSPGQRANGVARPVIGFRSRILALVIGLLAMSQIAVMMAVLNTTSRSVSARAQDELSVGVRVFEELLTSRQQQLLGTAQVLSSDFGFKEAVATEDLATIESALLNHGGRIAADAVLLVSLNGVVTAATSSLESGKGFPFAALLDDAQRNGQATANVLLEGRPHQLVMVPVNAPVRIAWAAMGFLLDDRLAEDLQALTGLEVTFAAIGTDAEYLASTLTAADRVRLLAQIGDWPVEDGPAAQLNLADDSYFTQSTGLGGRNGQRITALLQTSRTEAMAPYYEVRNQLLLIAGLTLLLSLLGGTLMARGVTRPINTLVAAASRIAHGNYNSPVPRESEDELGTLANAFNQMQEGIAQREERIIHQAHHDVLTGLPNRSSIQQRLEHTLSGNRLTPLILILLDIARFKQINDTLGHATGDAVLLTVANRLQLVVEGRGIAARVGGNEFLVILEDQLRENAATAARSLLDSIALPVGLHDANIPLSLNAGIACFPDDGDAPETLMRRADVALHAAKREDAGQPFLYRSGDDERHLRQLQLLHDLRAAIDNDELVLEFQPKTSLADGRLVGAEALVRWNHPSLGRVAPDVFIPLAEQSGLIQPLTHWVLVNALAACAAWRQAGLRLPVAVNLSGLDVLDHRLPETVRGCLAAAGLPPDNLTLEVTESMLMRDAPLARTHLQQLRAVGARLAIDDFGTGYSSLAQLRQLPVDELKIDRSFVKSMTMDTGDAIIVRTIIQLAHSLNLKVVAEGVETREDWDLLREYGCETGQGFGIGRPMPAHAVDAWHKQWRQQPVPIKSPGDP
ncbi:MAG: GGDEF domain-containing protein [Aquisalimonadaceae bacterium]